MNESEDIEPTLETIKKFADEKRKKKSKVSPELYEERQQKRLENLAKGREVRRLKLLEKNENVAKPEQNEDYKEKKKNPKKQIVNEDDLNNEETEEEQPKTTALKKTVKKGNHNNHNQEALKDLYDCINNIKDLINNQKDIIIEAVKSKPKPRAKPKPKPIKVEKILDLTISDVEVDKIINDNKEKTQSKSGDAKLNAFLEALQKK